MLERGDRVGHDIRDPLAMCVLAVYAGVERDCFEKSRGRFVARLRQRFGQDHVGLSLRSDVLDVSETRRTSNAKE